MLCFPCVTNARERILKGIALRVGALDLHELILDLETNVVSSQSTSVEPETKFTCVTDLVKRLKLDKALVVLLRHLSVSPYSGSRFDYRRCQQRPNYSGCLARGTILGGGLE